MISKFLSSVNLNANPIVVILLSVAPIIVFTTITCIQFIVVDKSVAKLGGDIRNKGLSRFCTGGLYVLFGFILFSLIIEFLTAYLINIKIKNNDIDVLNMIVESYRELPIELLINGSIFLVAIYTGAEGVIAGMKTLNIPAGLCIELPYIKRKRLSGMFVMWVFLSIVATIYHVIVGSDQVNFCVKNLFIGMIVDLVILFIAERTPTMLENKTSKTFDDMVLNSSKVTVVSKNVGPAVDEKVNLNTEIISAAVDER